VATRVQEEGFSVVTANPDNPEEALLQPQDSDIVCFVSLPDDEHGAHSAIVTMDASGDFPPNTLFRLRTVYGPGQWEAPGGVFPHQRLLEVTATYQPPRAGVAALDSGGSKMCGSVVTLGYNKREAFLKGLDDLLAKPVIAMAHEFSRGFKWKDWRGIEYTDKDEFAYVKGPAVKKTGCTPGTRDENNNGKTPQQFADAANDFIRSRRDKGFGTMLTEDHAYLTLDEVYAVRLYTGPAYQPINTFLRQIASLTSNFRNQVAQHPGLTYAATVGHMHVCRTRTRDGCFQAAAAALVVAALMAADVSLVRAPGVAAAARSASSLQWLPRKRQLRHFGVASVATSSAPSGRPTTRT
jgi:hypothetical protein